MLKWMSNDTENDAKMKVKKCLNNGQMELKRKSNRARRKVK